MTFTTHAVRALGPGIALGLLLVVPVFPGCSFAERAEQERGIESARSGLGPSWDDRSLDRILRTENEDRELDARLAGALTLESVRRAVVLRNPSVEVALERWVGFLARAPQRLAPPMPMLETRYSSMFRMLETGVVFGVPFPSKLLTEASAALAESRMARAEYSEQLNVLRAQAGQACATLYLARHELDVIDRNVAVLERLREAARAYQVAGKATLADVLKVDVELGGLKAEREDALGNVKIATSALNVLLDRRPDAPLGAVTALPEPAAPQGLGPLLERALATRPELLATQERVAAADQMASRARQEWIPDLQLGASYVRDTGMDRDYLDVMGGISLPVWFGSISARVREAEAEARRSRAEVRAARNRVLDEVAASAAQVEATAARFGILATTVVPRAKQAFESAEDAYAAGQVDFLALLDAQRTLLAKEIERERALAEHAMRRLDLEKAIGLDVDAGKEP